MLRLFIVVAQASSITAGLYAALVLTTYLASSFNPNNSKSPSTAVLLLVILLPIAAGTWWLFRHLQTICTRYEAGKVAAAFALFTPASLAITMVLCQLPAGYAEALGSLFTKRNGLFVLIGLVGGFVGILTLASFLLSVFVLWITRATNRSAAGGQNV